MFHDYMARDTQAKCRKCRRAMERLFLKGERCFSPKCEIVKRAYAPGVHGKKMSRSMSEYGMQLSVKQKIKRIYGILERQFRKHFEEVRHKKGITGDLFLARLEMRLDNVVYRIGIGNSRSQARQLVNHGWIRVNGRRVTIPSYKIKVGDVVSISEFKKDKAYAKGLAPILKNKKDVPSWISFSPEKIEAKIVNEPTRDDAGLNVDAQVVVEYYSR